MTATTATVTNDCTSQQVPLLAVENLAASYPQRRGIPPLMALDHVRLEVATGETVGLVGESGSGKSTLGNVILGMVRPAAGSITFNGEDITDAPVRRRRELTAEIQAVFQDPFGSLNPARTIGQTLEEGLLAHRQLSRGERRRLVAAALTRVGLPERGANEYPSSFSGGQRQRIAIARALMLDPQLVICDEAVSALDLSIQAQILNLLRSLQQELGLALLFITHDMAVVRHIADRVVVLYRGRVMESGSASQVCEDPQHPYTRRLVASAPVPDPAAQRLRRPTSTPRTDVVPLDSGCPFRNRCDYALDACAGLVPTYHDGDRTVACHRYPLPSADSRTDGVQK